MLEAGVWTGARRLPMTSCLTASHQHTNMQAHACQSTRNTYVDRRTMAPPSKRNTERGVETKKPTKKRSESRQYPKNAISSYTNESRTGYPARRDVSISRSCSNCFVLFPPALDYLHSQPVANAVSFDYSQQRTISISNVFAFTHTYTHKHSHHHNNTYKEMYPHADMCNNSFLNSIALLADDGLSFTGRHCLGNTMNQLQPSPNFRILTESILERQHQHNKYRAKTAHSNFMIV